LTPFIHRIPAIARLTRAFCFLHGYVDNQVMNTAHRNRPRKLPILALGLALLAAPPALLLLADGPPAPATPSPGTHSAPATATRPLSDRDRRKQEDIDKVMEFFKTTQPDLWEQARNLRDTNPQKFESLIRDTVGTVRRYEELKKRNQKLFDLTMSDLRLHYQSIRIAGALKKPDISAADKARFQKDLLDTVSEQFDVRQKIRQEEIDEQARKLKDLEDKLKQDRDNKDALIKKRVEELQDRVPKLDW
jgi:hypothetical protein